MSVPSQTRAYLLPHYQDKEGLPRQAQVCIVDVHVASGCTKGMGIYENEFFFFSLGRTVGSRRGCVF